MKIIAQTCVLTLAAGLAACATGPRPVVKSAAVCQDVTVPVYFEADDATLTPDGRRVIEAAARGARRCHVVSVSVVGLADAAGEPAANLELSRRRTAAVAEALVQAKLPTPTYNLAAAGEAGAVTADGKVRPVRRRADITLKLEPLK